jgi:hypothetical protein
MNNSTKMLDNAKYEAVMEMLSTGIKISEIAFATGINRSTISNWKQRNGRNLIKTVSHDGEGADRYLKTFIENMNESRRADYSYLLGLYLGDGCIYRLPKTYKLTITLDNKYDSLNEYTISVFSRFFEKPAYIFDLSLHGRGNAIDIITHSCTLPVIFPQHGRGRKHDRSIELKEWQVDIIDSISFVKGLMMSDGSMYVDLQCGNTKAGFTNKSEDIIRIFEKYLNKLNIEYKTYKKKTGIYMTTIHKQESVSRLVDLIGTKDSIK